MKRIIHTVDDLWNIVFMVILLMVVGCVLFCLPRVGRVMFGDPVFNGYYTKSSWCNQNNTWDYHIYIDWKNGHDECAFSTQNVEEFYRACDRFKVKINPGTNTHERLEEFETKSKSKGKSEWHQ